MFLCGEIVGWGRCCNGILWGFWRYAVRRCLFALQLMFFILKNRWDNLRINQKNAKFAHALYEMKTIAFILINSFPAASVVIGAVLLLCVVVLAVLFVLKVREVAVLKKEVFELRDTMRMMRYEEISLSRMLHTANKYVGPVEESDGEVGEPVAEEAGEMVVEAAAGEVAEEVAEEPAEESIEETIEESAVESTEEPVGEEAEEIVEAEEAEESAEEQEEEAEAEDAEKPAEELTEEPAAEPVVIEEVDETIEPAAQEEDPEPVVELEPEPAAEENPAVEEEPADEPVEVAEEPSAPQMHKQPINERRPAIPVDLFSAWFAENEDTPIEEPAAASFDESAEPVKTKSLADVVSEVIPSEAPSEVPAVEVEEAFAEAYSAQEGELEATVDATADVELSKEDERFCRKLERIVSTRLRNPNLNIDIIAAQFGIGRTNFYRKVRELMGMSPNDYLRKCRMERAAELLRTTEQPVSDVCAQVGMPDAQYFSRVFKTHFGVTPSAYRENNNQ